MSKHGNFRKLSKAKSDHAIEMLLTGEKTLPQIAAELEVPLATIADWALNPVTLRRILSWVRLANARTLVFASSARPNVSASLYGLACKENGGETARKACVDFLKLDLSKQAADSPSQAGGVHDQPRAMPEDSVRRALEMLGGLPAEKEAYRP